MTAAAKDFKKSDEPSTSNIDPSKITIPEGSLSEAAQAFQDFENSDLAKELQRSMQASLAAGTAFKPNSFFLYMLDSWILAVHRARPKDLEYSRM